MPLAKFVPFRLHMGRAWAGTAIEDECPCPKAPCGLAMNDPEVVCEHHNPADWRDSRTMRQMHKSDDCPCVCAEPLREGDVLEPCPVHGWVTH